MLAALTRRFLRAVPPSPSAGRRRAGPTVAGVGLALLLLPGPRPPAARAAGDLTLVDAVQRALLNNEQSGIAGARLEQARAERRRAVSVFLPDLTIGGTITQRDDVIRQDEGTGEAVLRPERVTVADATATLNIFDARAFPLLAAANRNLEAQEHDSAEIRRALAYDVAETFYAVLSTELARDAAARRLEVTEQIVNDARIRREAGLASANDVTRTELELASARLALTRGESAVTDSRLSLGRLIGEEVSGRLGDPPPDSVAVEAPEQLTERALSGRNDLKATVARAEALDKLAQEPLMGLIPSLLLRGNVRATEESGRSGREEDWSLALQFTWPILDGLDRYALADQRRAAALEQRFVSEGQRRDIARDVRRVLNDLATSRAGLEQALVALRVAEQNALEVRERFANGLATALEQADATAAEFTAGVEVARQRFALDLAELSLSRTLGLWPTGTQELADRAGRVDPAPGAPAAEED